MKIGDLFTDSHASDKLKYVLIEFWTLHAKLSNTSAIPNFRQRPNFTRGQNPFIEKKIIPQPKTTPGKSTNLLVLLTNSSWGKETWFHDGFWRTNDRWPLWYGCRTSATSETNSGNFPITSTQKNLNEKPPPKFQGLAGNGYLEKSIAMIELRYAGGDILDMEVLIFMTNLTSPLFALFFTQGNGTALDRLQGVLY